MSAISSLRFADLAAFEPSTQPLDEHKKGVRAAGDVAGLLDLSSLADKARNALPFRWAKPAAAGEAVTQREAAGALQRVFARLAGREPHGPQPHIGVATLRQVEKLPMDTLMMAVTMMAVQALGNVADAKGKALEIMANAERRIQDKQARDLCDQIEKAIEQQHKARKGGIFGAICDWVVGAVEVVSGVAKIVGGALSGNAMMVAGGTMDLMAGTAGLVKAVAETMALIDPKHADKYKSIANTAGKVQLAFEVLGAIVDITSAARNMVVTKVIPKAAKAALQEGAEHLVTAAVKEGSKVAVKEAAKELTEQIVKQISKEALDVLGREGLQKVVENAIKTAAKQAAQRGAEVAAKEVTEQVVKEIRKELIKAIVKAATRTAVNVTRGAVNGVDGVYSGIIAIEKAKLQKEIDMLIVDQQLMQAMFDMFEQQKKDTREQMKNLIEGQSTALRGGSEQMRQTAVVAQQGAASMAHVVASAI
ncbi:type III secretion system translocon subunit SctE [Trinickia symbiotica]|nr:type III secretion system translocon subunit SctE [Trinickia symbiotica]